MISQSVHESKRIFGHCPTSKQRGKRSPRISFLTRLSESSRSKLKGQNQTYLPQISLIIDSNNQLDKNFEDGSNNLVEKSRIGS